MPSAIHTLAGLPGFVMAGFLAQAPGTVTFRAETSASISWRAEASTTSVSTTVGSLGATEISSEVVLGDALSRMSLAALAKSVFQDSRSMEDWEKQATDNFVLSLFH